MTIAIGPASLIKAQIKSILDSLVTDGVLGAVIEEPINTDMEKLDFPGYPCAALGTSNMQSRYEYVQSNRRTYQYDILIVQLYENISGMDDIENIRDAIALKFDNTVTLNGAAPFGIEAVSSDPMPIVSQGKTYVVFNVTIKAATPVGLTYSF